MAAKEDQIVCDPHGQIAPFKFTVKPQPSRYYSSYSFFRDCDANDDGWSNIKKLEYRDLETARRDIHGKSLPLFYIINSDDLFSIKAAFVFAEDAVNKAQSAFESANRAIALANAAAADALALHNAQTKATEDPAAHKEDVPMVDYERGFSSEEARKALEYYKDTKDEEFELVEITHFETKLLVPYWITHVAFTAKPKDDMPDTCPKLFFAEVYENGDHLGEYEVKMCMTLDPSGPDVIMGCGYVKHDMPHPKGVKFWAGPLSATPESDKASDMGSSSADALALHNAQTKATYEAPPAHKEYVPIVDYEREIKRFSEVARKALKYYKDTKDEEFELVETTRFKTMLGFPYWITHVTFIARPKDDMPDTRPRLFFAVLYVRGEHLGEYEVKICEMCEALDLSGLDVIMDCGYVKHDMAHPKGVKFWAGPLSATPESDKASDMGSSSADAR